MANNDSRYPTYGNPQNTAGGDIVSSQELDRLANDAFRKSSDAMKNADIGKTTKFMGLFEVDAGLAAYAATIYNVLSDWTANLLKSRTYDITTKLGTQAGLGGSTLHKTAAVTTFGVTVALKAGGYVGETFSAISNQRKERIKLAHSLAPVLDEIKGKHSLSALYSVKESDNEVIYAHRKRLSKIEHTTNFNNIVKMGWSALPNIMLDVAHFKGMWGGQTPKQLSELAQIKAKSSKVQATGETVEGVGQLKNLGHVFINTTATQVADRVQKSSEHKLQTTLQPYSAWEMIRELEEQVANNPKAGSFQVPKSFQNPNRRGESYPLEEYVMRIFIQHQRDMAAISEDHTEIRDALKEDLMSVVKPIAEAIRKGDVSVTSLVRLVGEGKVIKNRGRAVASVEEVQTLIAHDAPKQTHYVHVDPKAYYAEATFTREDLKKTLKSLGGDERNTFASMLPDAVLEEAGMSAQDIKQMRDTVMKSYDRMLADVVVGLQGQTDEQLKQEGLAQNEISHLRKAYASVETGGVQALHSLMSGPTNDHGIERMILNLAVPQIKGDKAYLGTLIQQGHSKFDEIASTQETHAARTLKQRGHADIDLADEAYQGFGDREMRRKEYPRGQHSERDLG